MEDRAVEDEGYSDDDLDALPDHTFHELQEKAYSSTQQPIARPQLPALRQPPRHDPPGLAGGFGRLSAAGASAHAGNAQNFQTPSSDYGDFDDEMLDGEIFDAAELPNLAARYDTRAIEERVGETTQREHWRQQRYGLPPPDSRTPEQHTRQQQAARISGPNVAVPNAKYNDTQLRGPVRNEARDSIPEPFQGVADVEALQAQVQKVSMVQNSTTGGKWADLIRLAIT